MGCSPLLSAVNAWPPQAGPGAATTSDAPAPATPCSVAPSDLSVLEQLLAQTEGLDEEHCPSGQCGLTGGVSNNFFRWTALATQLRLSNTLRHSIVRTNTPTGCCPATHWLPQRCPQCPVHVGQDARVLSLCSPPHRWRIL